MVHGPAVCQVASAFPLCQQRWHNGQRRKARHAPCSMSGTGQPLFTVRMTQPTAQMGQSFAEMQPGAKMGPLPQGLLLRVPEAPALAWLHPRRASSKEWLPRTVFLLGWSLMSTGKPTAQRYQGLRGQIQLRMCVQQVLRLLVNRQLGRRALHARDLTVASTGGWTRRGPKAVPATPARKWPA